MHDLLRDDLSDSETLKKALTSTKVFKKKHIEVGKNR